MPSKGEVKVNLRRLNRVRERIQSLNARSTNNSINENFRRIAGRYNADICPADTGRLAASFRERIRRSHMTLLWGGIRVRGRLVDYAARVNRTGSARGFAQRIGKETARDLVQYAKTGRKPRGRNIARYGRNRSGRR